MLKVATLFLSFLIFSQSLSGYATSLGEVHTLMDHVQLHSEEYGDNFVVFLSKHYGELRIQHLKDNHDKKGDHEKLPFTHHNCSHTIVAVKEKAPIVSISRPISSADSSSNFGYSNLYSLIAVSGIFQPPKFS
jgi:hypothetical protein